MRRPAHWRVRTVEDGQSVILYAGPSASAALEHYKDDTDHKVVVTRNGRRVWPPAEELALPSL